MSKNFTVSSWTGRLNDSVEFNYFDRVDDADNFARRLRDSRKAVLVTVVSEKLGKVIGDFSS